MHTVVLGKILGSLCASRYHISTITDDIHMIVSKCLHMTAHVYSYACRLAYIHPSKLQAGNHWSRRISWWLRCSPLALGQSHQRERDVFRWNERAPKDMRRNPRCMSRGVPVQMLYIPINIVSCIPIPTFLQSTWSPPFFLDQKRHPDPTRFTPIQEQNSTTSQNQCKTHPN